MVGLEVRGTERRERLNDAGEPGAMEPSLLLWKAREAGTVGVMSRMLTSSMPSALSRSKSPCRDLGDLEIGDGEGERSVYAGVDSRCQLGMGISGSTDSRTSES